MFDNIKKDYKLYKRWSHSGFWVMMVYRLGNWCKTIRFGIFRSIMTKIYWLCYHFISTLTGVHLPRDTKFGERFHLIHASSIIIHKKATFGDDVGIMHEVTIGSSGTYDAPKIGNGVFIAAGAKVVGDITIGDNCSIGANAVVVKDIPPNSLVVPQAVRVIENHKRKEWVPPSENE